jgi:hypothetical protein
MLDLRMSSGLGGGLSLDLDLSCVVVVVVVEALLLFGRTNDLIDVYWADLRCSGWLYLLDWDQFGRRVKDLNY